MSATDAILVTLTAVQLGALAFIIRANIRRRRADPYVRVRMAFLPWFLQWGSLVLAGCVRRDAIEIVVGGALVTVVCWAERRERHMDRMFAEHPGLEAAISKRLREEDEARGRRKKP